ncbi:hypothetical protein CRD60_08030 [Bifidobacterium aemilianum]|uniref:Inosine/uridine-preferring nucleoside hydrolase domain-containing protein n=1 Tax=Bifidobacterium aemilianum TaxID=2493120 RepID=A0A366K7C3_9BIFI|nr:nucleoside hydrolase [Bifidobacterium aemilianum]RBP97207.1 hypothetical protein CRD60_08030 [Bifidobacterium aemilianum]
MNKEHTLIIDCDPGNGIPGANVDDAIALSYALTAPDLKLASIWTVFGNTSSDLGYMSAAKLLKSLGHDGSTLRRGSDQPISGDRNLWIAKRKDSASCAEAPEEWTSRQSGQVGADDDLSPYTSSNPPESSPHQLAEDLLAQPQALDAAAIGPLTNLARVISQEPLAAQRIHRIYAMGGTLGFGDLVDTNFAVDPEAARIVLNSGIPITLVPLDTTRTTHLSQETWSAIYQQADPAKAPWKDEIRDWLVPWLQFSERTRPVDGMWIHDLVAVAAINRPDLVTIEQTDVRIANNGKLYRANDPNLPTQAMSGPITVDLCTGVDNDGLIEAWAQLVMPA